MSIARSVPIAVLALMLVAACEKTPEDAAAAVIGSKTAVAREERLEKALAGTDSGGKDKDTPVARWVLPPILKEISGLAITKDDRLLVHGDESAQVWQVDYRRGVLVKRFVVGPNALKGDFEGITIANDVIWLLDSKGKLYEFREGAADAHVDFREHNTELGKDCEFEGLAYDPKIKAMLLACKNIKEKADQDKIIIFRWSLAPDSAGRVSKMVIPVSSVRAENAWTSLQVSDITVDSVSGNYVLLASQERAIVEITPNGEPVSVRVLAETHEQPEGIAIAKNLVLVSDEAVKGPATITLYRWR